MNWNRTTRIFALACLAATGMQHVSLAADLYVAPVTLVASDGQCSLIEAFVNAENDDPLDACHSRPRVYRSAH